MQIYFCGQLCGRKAEALLGNDNTTAYAIRKFNRNLANVLCKEHEVTIVSPIRTKKRMPRNERENGMDIEYLKYCGKFGRLWLIICTILRFLFVQKDAIIIADALNISCVYGLVKVCRVKKNKLVLIVTDIPEDVLENKKTIYSKIFLDNLNAADGYVFLTEQANEDYNTENKPFAIMEGIVQEDDVPMIQTDEEMCVYAGGLAEKYYVRKLVDSFAAVAKSNEVLYIFGDGECREYVEHMSNKCSSIKYMGTVDNQTVLKYEKAARLLINPRPNIGAYTKYSFPSKLIEYMASGTPALVNRLDGVPEEYYDQLFLFSGNGENAYQETVRKLLDMEDDELKRMGSAARKFIFERNGEVATLRKLNQLFMV